MEGREQAMHALTALKAVVPGFEKARLRNFGMTIGTRDSRKIIGRYILVYKFSLLHKETTFRLLQIFASLNCVL